MFHRDCEERCATQSKKIWSLACCPQLRPPCKKTLWSRDLGSARYIFKLFIQEVFLAVVQPEDDVDVEGDGDMEVYDIVNMAEAGNLNDDISASSDFEEISDFDSDPSASSESEDEF